jgi:CheY-like chemotaxis protein
LRVAAHVLVVDDSPVARAVAARRLRDEGLAVTAVGSVQEARRADLGLFDAALLDIELGDGLGTELAQELLLVTKALPIAFLTAGGTGASLVAAALVGPVFSKADVEEAVRWIAGAAARGGLGTDLAQKGGGEEASPPRSSAASSSRSTPRSPPPRR